MSLENRTVFNGKGGGGINNMSQGLGAALQAGSQILGSVSGENLDSTQRSIREGARGIISSLGPIGALVGFGTGVVDMLGDVTGLSLDNINKNAAKRADISGKAKLQYALSSIPLIGTLAGIGGKKTIKSYKSTEIDDLASAYGRSVNDINAAQDLSGKRMLGTGKANSFIRRQNQVNSVLTDIGFSNRIKRNNSGSETYFTQNQNLYSGHTPQMILSKRGGKYPELEEVRKLVKLWSSQSTEQPNNPQKFQNGGTMNIIPVGSLHSRRHNIEDNNPELKDQITSKGIPVVVKSEGGVVQTAEIEKEEWTLRREFTDKLEELYKSFQETPSNDVAIEAGKLICYELLKNTDDKGGLIKSIK